MRKDIFWVMLLAMFLIFIVQGTSIEASHEEEDEEDDYDEEEEEDYDEEEEDYDEDEEEEEDYDEEEEEEEEEEDYDEDEEEEDEQEEDNSVPLTGKRLPEFFGQGYNIFYGNPLETPSTSNGFRHHIFVNTYKKRQTTSEGKFLIPDNIRHTSLYGCHMKNKTVQITGTQDYQKEMKLIVSVEGGYSAAGFGGSFGLSTQYQNIEKSTNKQRNLDVMSTAKCVYHSLFMENNYFKHFTPSFIEDVKSTVRNNNWNSFIEKYGTHYPIQLLMGGRRTKTLTLRATSVAKMRMQRINIAVQAKAAYMGASGSASVQTSHGKKLSTEFAQSILDESETYIGGFGKLNLKNWVKSAKDHPQPVEFKLKSIEHLFSKISQLSSSEQRQAKQGFLKGVAYLNSRVTKPRTVNPPKLEVRVRNSPSGGGNGGRAIFYQLPNNRNQKYLQFMNVAEIHGGCGHYVDWMLFKFSNADQNKYETSPRIGRSGGTTKQMTIRQGDRISRFSIYYKSWIQGITVHTRKGDSWTCGRLRGRVTTISIGQNQRIVGFNARAGKYVDRLALRIGTDSIKKERPASTYTPPRYRPRFAASSTRTTSSSTSSRTATTPVRQNVKVQELKQYGGFGGRAFKYIVPRSRNILQLTKIQARCDKNVEGLKFYFSGRGASSVASPKYGGNGGRFQTISIAPGDRITKIEFYGLRIGFVRFLFGFRIVTQRNRNYMCGRKLQQLGSQSFGPQERIIGAWGASGTQINRLGFIKGTNY